MPSGGEWLWVILAIIILFGGKKIPELAKGVGKGIREFNEAKDGIKKEIESNVNAGTNATTAVPPAKEVEKTPNA
ncbi:MAG: twin-arginine translocase TatA/TatE family subunit [Taibaiella sp.]|nr:twin-arginine translocase TatA/TatE family subunit [Taibaiella sp.]